MTEVKGFLRDFRLSVPEAIYTCNGIKICGRRIKSVLFSTDVSIIRNSNADAVIAVYPFTPQPVITQAVMMAADTPGICRNRRRTYKGRASSRPRQTRRISRRVRRCCKCTDA